MDDVTRNPVAGQPSEDLWRSLKYFNLYRLALASLFVFLAGAFGSELSLGPGVWKIFFVTGLIYAVIVTVSFGTLYLRWPNLNWQLAVQMAGDIVCLTILSNASGGIQSNVSLLLLVSLAAAGMISRGKITLFFASLTSIAALLEHSYAVLYTKADTAQFIQVGLLCMSYFAVAWLAHTLARYAVDSQRLAQRRGRELVNLAEANRLVMRDMQDGILVVDGAGRIMQMNQRAERLLRNNAWVGGTMLEIFPVLYRQYENWRQSSRVRRDTVALDGGVQARLRFVAIDHDPDSGAVIFLEDMQRMRAEAQQIKLAALGRLTANIAHEVRNPLSAISYATELMREEEEDPDQQRLLQIVMDNTQRINQIVQDVMQLNRRDRAESEVLNLDTLLHAFVEELCMAEQIQPEVVALTGTVGVHVRFDRGHLRQILWNLCRNALRYGHRVQGSLRLSIGEDGGRVVLDVQDDGPGIVSEQQGKLFEPFFTTASDGTGLGLYIARELCEANGAQLEYHEAGGGLPGACFRITFGEQENEEMET